MQIGMVTHVVDGLIVQVFGWDDLLDDLLLDLLAELLSGDVLAVLRADDDGVDTERNNCTAVMLVLDGNLCLGVGSQPWETSRVTGLFHGRVKLVGKKDGEGKHFGGLVGGIAEHDALITGTQVLESLVVVETLSDIGRLLLNGDQDVAGLVVEALVRVVVTNVLDGATDNGLVVETGFCGDLAKDHDHARLGGGLACDLGEWIFAQAGVEDGIGDLVTVVAMSIRGLAGLETGANLRDFAAKRG
jgi:hypothetical protein